MTNRLDCRCFAKQQHLFTADRYLYCVPYNSA